MREPILEFLKGGPRTTSDLLHRGEYSPRTLYKRLNVLVEEGRILEFPLKQGNRWMALYCLPRHKEWAQRMSGRSVDLKKLARRGGMEEFAQVVKRLRRKLKREPTEHEVADQIVGWKMGELLRTFHEAKRKGIWSPDSGTSVFEPRGDEPEPQAKRARHLEEAHVDLAEPDLDEHTDNGAESRPISREEQSIVSPRVLLEQLDGRGSVPARPAELSRVPAVRWGADDDGQRAWSETVHSIRANRERLMEISNRLRRR